MLFRQEDSMIILLSVDGDAFATNARELHELSPAFSGMLDMPGESNGGGGVQLTESSSTLRLLTRYINGDIISPLSTDSVNVIASTLVCADKYLLEHLAVFLRVFLGAHWEFFAKDPMELYHLVRRQGWDEYAWKASRESLRLNIDAYLANTTLRDAALKSDVMVLRALHQGRKDALKMVVSSGLRWKEGRTLCNARCVCGERLSTGAAETLDNFRADVHAAIDDRPLGDFLWSSLYWCKEAMTIMTLKCSACGCLYFDVGEVLWNLSSPQTSSLLSAWEGVF